MNMMNNAQMDRDNENEPAFALITKGNHEKNVDRHGYLNSGPLE